jgi:hypothetical protein
VRFGDASGRRDHGRARAECGVADAEGFLSHGFNG